MTEEEIRAEVARRLRRESIPNEVWNWVLDREYVAVARRGGLDSIEFKELVDEARDLLGVFRAGAVSGGGRRGYHQEEDSGEVEEVTVEISAYTEQRAAAYTEYAAKLVADDVEALRDSYLGGRYLAPEEAWEYLKSNGHILGDSTVRRLARTFPWSEKDVAWLFLTGEVPVTPPLTGNLRERWGRVNNYGVVELAVEPWVPADEVRNAYVRLRKKLRARKRVSDRHLALFRFVVSQAKRVRARSLGERVPPARKGHPLAQATELEGSPSWSTLLGRWNEKYPPDHAWHYKSRRNLSRDFREAEYRIANPIKGRDSGLP